MTAPIIGFSCGNCGKEVNRPRALSLRYACAVGLEAPNQPGVTETLASFSFTVFRATGDKSPMLLCDGCMGAALKAVCESILSDMKEMSREDAVSH